MLTEGKESDLLEKAEAEEKAYNWVDAAKIYERIIESSLKDNMMVETANIYKK